MKHKKYVPLLYILPALVFVLVLVYVPVAANVVYSFFNMSAYSSNDIFVGLENYAKVFSSEILPIALRNNIYYAVISLIVQVGLGTVLAALLESKAIGRRASGVYRNILFVPALLSLTAVGLLFSFVYQPDIGLLNNLLETLGLGTLSQAWLGNSNTAIFAVIAMSQWQFTGYITLMMVVAIQKVDPEYYEAAEMDGASAVQRFFFVTLPQVKEQLLVSSIITIIGSFKLFTEVYATTAGGPGNSSQELGLYMYQNAFLYDSLGTGAAVGVIIFVVTVGLSIVQLRMGRSGQE